MRPAALSSALLYVVTEVGLIAPPRDSPCCSGMSKRCFNCAQSELGRWQTNDNAGAGEDILDQVSPYRARNMVYCLHVI